MKFHSSDYTSDASLRPKLVVDYTEGQGGPTAVTLNNPTDITQNSMTLSWSQNTDADFASYKLYRSTTQGVTEASTLATTQTNSTITTHTDTNLQPNTTYYYKVYVVNTANVTAGSNEVSATTQAVGQDTTAPTVTFTAPQANATLGGSEAQIVVHYADNVAVSKVQLFVDQEMEPRATQSLDPAQASGEVTFALDSMAFGNGAHALKAKASDTATGPGGMPNPNVGEAQLAVTFNNPAPSVAISAPLANSAVQGVVAVTGAFANTPPADKPISKVELYVDTDPQTPIPPYNITPPTLTGPFTFNWDSSTVKNGEHTLTVKAYDTRPAQQGPGGQNEGVGATTVSITVNNPLPTITLDQIANRPWPMASPIAAGRCIPVKVSFYRNAPNNALLTQLLLFCDPPENPTEQQMLNCAAWLQMDPIASGSHTFLWDATGVTGGAHSLQAWVKDTAGNYGLCALVPVTVEAGTPTGEILSPVAGETVGGVSVATRVKFFSRSGKRITRLELWLDHEAGTGFGQQGSGSLLASQYWDPATGPVQGQQTFTWDATGKPEGAHTLTLRVIEDHRDQWGAGYYAEGATTPQPIAINNTSQNLPPAPVTLEIGNVTDTSVTLNWTETAIADFQKYEVHKGITANFTPDPQTTLVGQVVELATTTFGLSPLVPDKDYWFKILVYDTAGQATASNEVHVKTLTTLALFNTPPAGTSFLIETRKYDDAGQLVARYDGKGNGTFYTYNAVGQQTKVTDALGNETTFTYDAAGRKTNELNALNGQTSFAYDNAGRMISTTDALANVTQFGYDADGNQTTVTDARGNVTTRAYNSRNRLMSVTDAMNNTTTFAYDAVGNKLNELNALNQQTTFTYDAAGKLITQTDPANHVTSFEYDAVGNRTKVTDANGNQTLSAYNLRNLRTTETNALNQITTFGYDAVGNRTSVTDGKGATWTYTFDWANRESSMTQPDSTVERKTYDVTGALLAKLKPDGNVIRYEHDKLNRLVKKDYPTGVDTTFAYDALGRRTQMVDSTGTTSYTYDLLGRLLSCTQPCGAVSKTVSYTYDPAGNRATMTDPDGGVQAYVYDANDRLTSTTSPYAGTTSYVYDALGRVTRQNNGNGTYVLNTFDVAGNLTLLENRKSDNSLLSSFAYTVDNVGNRLSITESLLGTDNTTYHNATVTYGYDNLYRLISEHRVPANPSANNPAFWYEYSYDAAGNRLMLTQNDEGGNVIGTTASTYDAANKLLTAGNTSYTWDANGNQTGKTVNNVTTTYIWDHEDKMTALYDGVSMAFAYDGDGLRLAKSNLALGQSCRFVYDGPVLLLESAEGGVTQRMYVTGMDLVAEKTEAGMRWEHLDAVASIRSQTSAAGATVSSLTYTAYGTPVAAEGTDLPSRQFCGGLWYYRDLESGFDSVFQRYLAGEVGGFLSPGPARAGANWYTYAASNPATYVDTGARPAVHPPRPKPPPDIEKPPPWWPWPPDPPKPGSKCVWEKVVKCRFLKPAGACVSRCLLYVGLMAICTPLNQQVPRDPATRITKEQCRAACEALYPEKKGSKYRQCMEVCRDFNRNTCGALAAFCKHLERHPSEGSAAACWELWRALCTID